MIDQGAIDVDAIRQKRREIYPPEAATHGWVFYVPVSVFASTIDLLPQTLSRTRKTANGSKHTVVCRTWAQGVPPLYAFSSGLIFYSNADDARKPWGALLEARVVQIKDVINDVIVFDDMIVSGGRIRNSVIRNCSTNEFARFLETGVL